MPEEVEVQTKNHINAARSREQTLNVADENKQLMEEIKKMLAEVKKDVKDLKESKQK